MRNSDLMIPQTLAEYVELDRWLDSVRLRSVSEWTDAMRWYTVNDLFFLVSRVLTISRNRHSEYGNLVYNHDYYLSLSRDVEYMAWQRGSGSIHDARGMGKSTVANFALNIQRMLKYPNSSGVIVSELKLAAQKHLRVVKLELEVNELLKKIHEDKLEWDPVRASKVGNGGLWSSEAGLTIKGMTTTRKEPSLAINSFFDGTPVGGHYEHETFDDCETKKMIRGGPDRVDIALGLISDFSRCLMPIHMPKTINILVNTWWHRHAPARLRYEEYRAEDKRAVRAVPGEDLNKPGEGPMGGTPNYPYTLTTLQKAYDESPDKIEYALQVCLSFQAALERRLSAESLVMYEESVKKRCRGRYIYVCIDPSRGVGDPLAALFLGTDWDGKVSLIDAIYDKIDAAGQPFADRFVATLTRLERFGGILKHVRVEEVAGTTWEQLIQGILKKNGINLRVYGVRAAIVSGKWGDSKVNNQYEMLSGPLHDGEMCIPKPQRDGGPGLIRPYGNLETIDVSRILVDLELGEWPQSSSDHMLDAWALLYKVKSGIPRVDYPDKRPSNRPIWAKDERDRREPRGGWLAA